MYYKRILLTFITIIMIRIIYLKLDYILNSCLKYVFNPWMYNSVCRIMYFFLFMLRTFDFLLF